MYNVGAFGNIVGLPRMKGHVMKVGKFLSLLAVATIVSFVDRTEAVAQFAYNQASFSSYALAETDAGSEYAYEIDESENISAPDTYSFTEYGQAPGYSSSATVGVEHDSTLTNKAISLYGKAYTYVADDYGYAVCSADSEVSSYIRFTVTKRTRVNLTGSLAIGGTSSPDWSYSSFELRKENGPMIASSNGGTFSFVGPLKPGTYVIVVTQRVLRQIDFSGGDVYENSFGTYNISMTTK